MKQFIILLILGLFLSGCATIKEGFVSGMVSNSAALDKELYNKTIRKEEVLTKIYDMTYQDVYTAIVNMLENRVDMPPNPYYTKGNVIYSSWIYNYPAKAGRTYSYLFQLKEIDETHTQVTLKSTGALISISNKDILYTYLADELNYIKSTKQ